MWQSPRVSLQNYETGPRRFGRSKGVRGEWWNHKEGKEEVVEGAMMVVEVTPEIVSHEDEGRNFYGVRS